MRNIYKQLIQCPLFASVSSVLVLVGVVLSLAALVTVRLSAQTTLPPDAVKVLQQIKAADKDQLAVSEEDGRFLRVMIAAGGATRALEIGTAEGYSAIWIGLALRQTGGRLITIEYDAARARAAAGNIRRAGLADVVTVVSGDAFERTYVS